MPCGMEIKLENGESVLRFPRADHRECRIFIEGDDSVISVKENAPVSAKFRRAIRVEGLKNATLRFFPERGFEDKTYLVATEPRQSIDAMWSKERTFIGSKLTAPHGYLEFENLNGCYFIITEYPELSD
jgi:hypothetical protein